MPLSLQIIFVLLYFVLLLLSLYKKDIIFVGILIISFISVLFLYKTTIQTAIIIYLLIISIFFYGEKIYKLLVGLKEFLIIYIFEYNNIGRKEKNKNMNNDLHNKYKILYSLYTLNILSIIGIIFYILYK